MEKVYLHALSTYVEENRYLENYYSSRQTIILLNKVLKRGALLSLRNQRKLSKSNFTGSNYISLCDYDKRNLFHKDDPTYNSYNVYIRNYLSLMFDSKNIDAVVPKTVNISNKDLEGFRRMEKLGKDKLCRYSDLVDEVQVKDKLLLTNLIGLTLPTWLLINKKASNDENIYNIVYEVNKIKTLLDKYNYKLPIYDIDSFSTITNENEVEKLILVKKD
ncbi:MAG: hypothetical protein GX758_03390 [Tenericutes bacterium]|nr:hypothetical protein [Mycoplasmatota bacterium]